MAQKLLWDGGNGTQSHLWWAEKWLPKEFLVLMPESLNMLPYLAKGTSLK